MRIQSSHCEANAFYKVLESLDNNLLFHLATGARCVVYDLGSRSTRWPSLDEDETSSHKIPRALWWGLEWSRYALARLWRVDIHDRPLLRGNTAVALFDEKYSRIPKALYKRLKYFRKFDPQVVDLRGVYRIHGTAHDGDDATYARMAQGWCEQLLPMGQYTTEKLSLPPQFIEYRSNNYAGIGRGKCVWVERCEE